MFSPKDMILDNLKSHVVYKFTCDACKASYIDETTRHISTRISEHLTSDKKSKVYKHIRAVDSCKAACNKDSFVILDNAPTQWQLKIKEGLHIKWENPPLNKQLKHVAVSLFF